MAYLSHNITTDVSVRACTSCPPLLISHKQTEGAWSLSCWIAYCCHRAVAKHRFVHKIPVLSEYIHYTLTKLRNDELPSVKDADLVNYVVLASVYTYEQLVSYRTTTGRW